MQIQGRHSFLINLRIGLVLLTINTTYIEIYQLLYLGCLHHIFYFISYR